MTLLLIMISIQYANGSETTFCADKYNGTKQCFKFYKQKYSKPEWPDPEIIGVFNAKEDSFVVKECWQSKNTNLDNKDCKR